MRLSVVLGAALAVGACTATSRQTEPTTQQVDAVAAVTTKPPTAQSDYRIAPQDVLEVSVFQVSELTRTVPVPESGLITLPLIGAVQAAGRTPAELEADVAAKLDAKYLQSPQVSIVVKEFTSQRITVDGAVNKPGIFPTTGRVSLLQAIALAAGLQEVADSKGVLVFRQVDGKRTAARFDIGAIRSGKADDPPLLAGDVVMVDTSATKTALRDIKGALPLTGLFRFF